MKVSIIFHTVILQAKIVITCFNLEILRKNGTAYHHSEFIIAEYYLLTVAMHFFLFSFSSGELTVHA